MTLGRVHPAAAARCCPVSGSLLQTTHKDHAQVFFCFKVHFKSLLRLLLFLYIYLLVMNLCIIEKCD